MPKAKRSAIPKAQPNDESPETDLTEVESVDSAAPPKKAAKKRNVPVAKSVPVTVVKEGEPADTPAADEATPMVSSKRRWLIGITAAVLVVGIGAVVWSVTRQSATPTNTNTSLSNLNTATDGDLVPRLLDGTLTGAGTQNRWPVAIMLDNLPAARPQYGISLARVVYETLAEGGATRFMALYDGSENANRIGPVRSARHYYIQLADEYQALYVHAGGSPQAASELTRSTVTDLNLIGSGSKYGYRVTFKRAPHNLFIDDSKLTFALRDKKLLEKPATFASWAYAAEPDLTERPTTGMKITVPFSSASYNVVWTYNRTTNSFDRTMGGRPHIDGLNNQAVTAKNIVVMSVPREIGLGEAGRIDVDVTGQGAVTVYQSGKAITGTWKKASSKERVKFVDDAGVEIPLHPGTTWIEVLPAPRTVTVSS